MDSEQSFSNGAFAPLTNSGTLSQTNGLENEVIISAIKVNKYFSDSIGRRTFVKCAAQVGGLVLAGTSIEALLAACSGNGSTGGGAVVASQGLITPGNLQWGADYVSGAPGAPYVFQDPTNPQHLIGFEVEIAAAMAALMRINQTQVEVCYANLEQALAENQIDMVMNGWEKTPDRERTELFSDPYYRSGQQIIIRVGDTRFADHNPTDVSVLGGYTVGTSSGYQAETIMNEYNATNPPKKISVHSYAGNIAFIDLLQQKVDAFFLDFPIAAYYAKGTSPRTTPIPQLTFLGGTLNKDNYYVGFNKSRAGAALLLPEINRAIAILKANGTLYRIYTKWQLWNDDQATIGVMKG